MVVENPQDNAPVLNIRRQVTCSACGVVGHTMRSRNCAVRLAGGAVPVPVEVPQNGGQFPEGGDEEVGNRLVDGIGIQLGGLKYLTIIPNVP